MPLNPGSTLGSYSVTAKIGEGGMGEVYQARDTKLDRDVALKVLPEAFTADPDRLARFEREAKVLASLNHPNIGSIYGLEEAEGVRALVLELVEGQTLADRIKQGPIPLDEALPIAKQIADALEAAHERGVIHRDLKPANVKVKDDGTVKVLDFGLAKAFQPDAGDPSTSMSPTISLTAAATQMGMVIGTAAYMSPEQAKGKVADKRADIWAFGVVLLEMLTGHRVFSGETVSETLAAVMMKEPEWDRLPADLPSKLSNLLRRCLEKDPRERVRDIGDVRLAMEGAFETAVSAPSEPTVAPKVQVWQRPIPAASAALVVAIVSGLAVWSLNPDTVAAPQLLKRYVIGAPDDVILGGTGRGNHLAVSPDGGHLVYIAGGQLYLRPMDQLTATPLPGTDGPYHPFFSPDGRWVVFFGETTLKKVLHSGGSPLTVTDVGHTNYRGATWAPDDTIIFGTADGLMRVAASEGTPAALTTVDIEAGDVGHRWPEMLPGGNALLFTIMREGGLATARIAVLSLDTGDWRIVLDEEGYNARYAPTGHVVYIRAGMLMAVPFDLDRLELTGTPVPILDGIQVRGAGAADFAFSRDGALVYITGNARIGGVNSRTLVWVDRQGREEAVAAEPRGYREFTLSPDGTRVAVRVADVDNEDVWIYDLERETSTRLTFDPADDRFPVWTPDGERVAFGSPLSWKAADGTGEVEPLAESPNQFPQAFSPDGTALVFEETTAGFDLGVLTLEGERGSTLVLQTEFDERNAALSPDGRWIAYQSNESGVDEVYVRPFPDVETGRWQVSSDGGAWPLWGPEGRELFYGGRQGMMAVAVDTEPTFSPGTPERLFGTAGVYASSQTAVGRGRRQAAVSPDGERFLMLRLGIAGSDSPATAQINVVLNWFEELNRLVPVP